VVTTQRPGVNRQPRLGQTVGHNNVVRGYTCTLVRLQSALRLPFRGNSCLEAIEDAQPAQQP
jgi:hypothetical protein